MTVSTLLSSRALRVLVGALAALLIALGVASPVAAHTDFESSDPTAGDVLDRPVAAITLTFTNAARPAGDGFQVLTPDGAIREPDAVETTDDRVFVLRFDPALTGGLHGVRWQVQAGDAHPIDGSFSFEIAPPSPTTVPVVDAPTTRVPGDATPPAAAAAGAAELDAFLSTGSAGEDSATVGGLGRIITFVGTIFGVGALAALVWVVRGHRDELRDLVGWIRLAGVAIAAGGLVELAALQSTQAVGVVDLLGTKAGFAALLKLAGGAAVWFGFHGGAGRLVGPPSTLSAAAMTEPAPFGSLAVVDPTSEQHGHRWSPSTSAALGLAGYSLVLASYWFDGHTVSKGPWAFHSMVNLVHLGAAAVWGGGVFAMTTVAWHRRRRGEHAGMAAMVVRFSSVATVSLATVIVAGLAMAALILESPAELLGTDWGRLLVAKTATVSVAAVLGGYNHFRLKPALEQRPDDPELARELRVSLTVESMVFVAITILTAWLVAAAT